MSKENDRRTITRRTYDTTTSESLTAVVVEAIASHRGLDELEPDFLLYEKIDIESLDGLVNSNSPRNLRTQFEVEDFSVRVQQETETEFSITVTDREHDSRQ